MVDIVLVNGDPEQYRRHRPHLCLQVRGCIWSTARFDISGSRAVKRAGLDYWHLVDISV